MVRASQILLGLFGAVILAAAGYELVLATFHYDLRELYAAEDGVLAGHPHWRMFQSRILAPAIFGLIRHAAGWQTPTTYKVSFILLLSLFYLSLACCLWSLTKTPRTVAFGLLGAFALSAILLMPNPIPLMDTSRIYLWDLIDLTIFTLLAWTLLCSERAWALALIVAVEIFNREIALTLAGLMLIDGFVRRGLLGARRARRQMILGAALAIGGFVIIEALRRALLIAEVGPVRWPWVVNTNSFLNIEVFRNIAELAPPHMPGRLKNMFPQYATILAFAGWILYQARHGPGTSRRAALWFAVLFVSVFFFGYTVEWRVWLLFVPYTILTLAISGNRHYVNSDYRASVA